jgi:hypothetical protein
MTREVQRLVICTTLGFDAVRVARDTAKMVWYFCDPLGNQQADGSGLFLDVIDGFEVLINIAPWS